MVAGTIRVLVILVLVMGVAGPAAAGEEALGASESSVAGAGVAVLSPWQEPTAAISEQVLMVSGGYAHTCAVTVDGGAKCWGANYDGQLGDGTTIQARSPVNVVGLASGVVAISAGSYHTCALTSSGGVKCWGNNWAGQLGNGTTAPSSTPVDVAGLSSGVIAISGGYYHTCALTSTDGVKCWGYNVGGQLGNGTTIDQHTPVSVDGLSSGVATVFVGSYHSCALTVAGGVKCWGSNYYGQLGDGTTTNRSTPVDVVGLANGVTVITAGGYNTCAVTNSGGVKCWGDNYYSQLGDGTTTNSSLPVDVLNLPGETAAVSLGEGHTCALNTGGGVRCWGFNGYGELGDGTRDNRNIPVGVVGLSSSVSAIDAGAYHTCGLTIGGGVKCWGNHGNGQLGDGKIADASSTPVDVLGLEGSVYTTITKSGSNVVLTWLHMASAVFHYEIYRSASTPYFEPGGPGAVKLWPEPPAPPQIATEVTFTDTGALDSPGTSYFYVVVPVNHLGEFYATSNRTGAFNYGMTPGSGLRRR